MIYNDMLTLAKFAGSNLTEDQTAALADFLSKKWGQVNLDVNEFRRVAARQKGDANASKTSKRK